MRVINNVAESVKDDLAATIEKGRKLSVTALSRERGMSGNIDLEKIVWENYDLVVIDESHNFRNGGEVYGENERDNRYNVLLKRVIRAGVKTKVLMRSKLIEQNMLFVLEHDGASRLAVFRAGRVLESGEKPLGDWRISLTGPNLDSVWENMIV